MNIQSLAKDAAQQFETALRATGDTDTGPREDGDPYVRVKDGAPEWITELVYAAHGDAFLPDDYRYATIREALEVISELGPDAELDDEAMEFASGTDIYTGRLLAWVGSNLNRLGYIADAVDELGERADTFIGEIINGQYLERQEIYGLVRTALEERRELAESEAQ